MLWRSRSGSPTSRSSAMTTPRPHRHGTTWATMAVHVGKRFTPKACFEKALALNPKCAYAWNNLGTSGGSGRRTLQVVQEDQWFIFCMCYTSRKWMPSWQTFRGRSPAPTSKRRLSCSRLQGLSRCLQKLCGFFLFELGLSLGGSKPVCVMDVMHLRFLKAIHTST